MHDKKAVWDLPRNCQIPLTIQPQTESKYHILNKKSNVINGKGWKCSKKYSIITTWTDWLNNKRQAEVYEDLSREDCLEMIRTKMCDKEKCSVIMAIVLIMLKKNSTVII